MRKPRILKTLRGSSGGKSPKKTISTTVGLDRYKLIFRYTKAAMEIGFKVRNSLKLSELENDGK